MKYEVVGSFLPPAELIDARKEFNAGHIDRSRFVAIEDEAVRQLIDSQIECGLATVTTGELRRRDWDKDFFVHLGGITKEYVDSGRIYQDMDSYTDMPRFTGRISYNPEHPGFTSFKFLRDYTGSRALPRQTVPSPTELYLDIMLMSDFTPSRIYCAPESLADDIASAYRQTFAKLYELGCRRVQLDDSVFGRLCDPEMTRKLLQGGVDLDAFYTTLIGMVNKAIEGLPSDMKVSIYISGGPNVVPEWNTHDIADNIVPKALGGLKVDKFYLPFDAGATDTLQVLRYIPAGREVALGLLNAHTPFPDNKERVERAVRIAENYIPASRLSISPQSGFKLSSFEERGLLYADQWSKIRQLAEIASEL